MCLNVLRGGAIFAFVIEQTIFCFPKKKITIFQTNISHRQIADDVFRPNRGGRED